MPRPHAAHADGATVAQSRHGVGFLSRPGGDRTGRALTEKAQAVPALLVAHWHRDSHGGCVAMIPLPGIIGARGGRLGVISSLPHLQPSQPGSCRAGPEPQGTDSDGPGAASASHPTLA
jgi:hypothetical protein